MSMTLPKTLIHSQSILAKMIMLCLKGVCTLFDSRDFTLKYIRKRLKHQSVSPLLFVANLKTNRIFVLKLVKQSLKLCVCSSLCFHFNISTESGITGMLIHFPFQQHPIIMDHAFVG